MFLVKDGKAVWTYSTGKGPEYDDVWMLSNGNVLFTRMKYIALITPDKKVLWRYDCDSSKGAGHTEVHSCQPIGFDRVMFVVNGLPPKLMVVNIKTGAIEVDHELPYDQPANPNDIHRTAKLYEACQRQQHFRLTRPKREGATAYRSNPGQESSVGTSRLEKYRRRYGGADS